AATGRIGAAASPDIRGTGRNVCSRNRWSIWAAGDRAMAAAALRVAPDAGETQASLAFDGIQAAVRLGAIATWDPHPDRINWSGCHNRGGVRASYSFSY